MARRRKNGSEAHSVHQQFTGTLPTQRRTGCARNAEKSAWGDSTVNAGSGNGGYRISKASLTCTEEINTRFLSGALGMPLDPC